MTGPWGVYVHVPWCRVHCPYCAFDVSADPQPDVARWLAGVCTEFDVRRGVLEGRPSTLYIGGGTPSRIGVDAVARVITAVAPAGETTIEANPEDVDVAWLQAIRAAGVNRLSLGVQSFDAGLRKRLGRAWVSADPVPVAQAVADAGFDSWSIDLIFAVPGQTLATLDADLDQLLALGAPHVSLYGLTFEPGTPFERARAKGRMRAVDDEDWRTMYGHIVARLRAEGFERYELSNFARPGHRSAHNRLYWTNRPYLGLGPSAHGYLPDGSRYANRRGIAAWSTDPTESVERPDPHQAATDTLVSSLRTLEGVDLAALRHQTGLTPSEAAIEPLVQRGLLTVVPPSLRLTDEGAYVCDAVVRWLADRLVRTSIGQ